MAQPNSLLSLLNDDGDDAVGSTDASEYQALLQQAQVQQSLGNRGVQPDVAGQPPGPQTNGMHPASQAMQRQHTPSQLAPTRHANQPAQQQPLQQPVVYRAPAASQPAAPAAQQNSTGAPQHALHTQTYQQQLQQAQNVLRIIPHESQQAVLKDWTALYQKSGVTFNQFLVTLQQKSQRQAQQQAQQGQNAQQPQVQNLQRQPSPQPRPQQQQQQLPLQQPQQQQQQRQQQSSAPSAAQQVPQHAQAQQPAQANGASISVEHMRQWLAARITEPARRMLDYHMDSYAVSQHDTQKRNDWGKRLGDIVGLKLLAEYQSAVQGVPAQQPSGGPARPSAPTPPPRQQSASPQPHPGVPITQNISQYSTQPVRQPQQQQLQQQPQYSQAMQASQQQYRPPGLPTPSAPQQQQQQKQYQRPAQPQSQATQHQQNQYQMQMRLQQQQQQMRLQQQHAQQGAAQPPAGQSSLQQTALAAAQAARQSQTSAPVLGKQPASAAPAAEPAAKRPKKEEEDFNDVLQGTNVNLEAEKEGMLGSTQLAATIATLPLEKLVLNESPFDKKAKGIARQHGIPTVSPNLRAYLSRALEAHMGNLLRRAYVIARQRSDVGRRMPGMEKAGSSARTEVYAIEEWERVQAEAALAKEQEEAILQAAARENKDNKEVKERAERARAAKAEREGAAATAQAYKSALGLSAKPDWGAPKPKATPAGAGAAAKAEKQDAAASSSPGKLPAEEPPDQADLPASAQAAADKAGNAPGAAPAQWGMRAPALQKPQQGERRTLALKDLIATLERDPYYCKSTLLYKLYERLD